MSTVAFRILNREQRFVLILDGFDEMKFAMAPNDFNYISSEIRKAAAENSKLLLLGRPSAIQTEEEELRLTSSKLQVHELTVRSDDAPEFTSLRLSLLTRQQYLLLIRKFLEQSLSQRAVRNTRVSEILTSVEALDLGDILSRPVQAKMLADVVAEPDADISSISRFTLYDIFIKRVLRREEEKAARRHLGSPARINFMRLLAWWLWTDKKTRTFAANEIPIDIVEKFEMPGVTLEGLRRELLIGSVIEERRVGHFLSEKTADVFYFPHSSFVEFLVADYIMSSDFLNIDVAKLPNALYGEVPTFLDEHPSGGAIASVFNRLKAARVAMSTACINVLLNDFNTRLHIELVNSSSVEPWDICLHYFFLRASNAVGRARQFSIDCLNSTNRCAEFAGMFCLMYENTLSSLGQGAEMATLVLHIFQKIGITRLISSAQRGEISSPSSEMNHLAEVVNQCIKIERGMAVSFDFAEFTKVALSFVGTSCAVLDVIETMRKTYSVPGNDLLALLQNGSDRPLLAELLRTGAELRVIPSL